MLDFKMLKNSENKKYRKIHEKAVRMINEGWETEEITEDRVKELNEKFPTLKIKYCFGDAIVQSEGDEWFIEDEGFFLTLYHDSKKHKVFSFKHKYHVQDVFYDIDYLMASIVTHDQYAYRGIRGKLDTIQELAFGYKDSFA